MLKKITLIALTVFLSIPAMMAQDNKKSKEYYVKSTIDGTDTMPYIELNEVNIFTKKSFANSYEEAVFHKLRRQVISVYPYAMMAKEIYGSIEEDLEGVDKKRAKKRYLKDKEKALRAEFEDKLKDLNVTQGKLLVKMVNRETGNNCFELIKELKNPVSAFFWNNISKVHGYDLKEQYDPEGVDKDLEYIIRGIEGGYITLNR